MDNRHLLMHIQQQRRRIEVALAFRSLTAENQFRALFHRAGDFLLHALQRGGINQRSHRNIVTLARIAIFYRFQRLAKPVHKAIVNPFLHIHPLGAVTHLPGIDHPRINNRFYRQVQIRVVHHDSGSLAAEFQADFGNVFRGGSHDFFPGPYASGHADHSHFRIARQFLTDRFAASQHQVKDPFWQTNLMDDFGKGDGIIWRKFAGFDNDGIAGNERRSQLAGDQEKREVPRQDAGRDAERTFENEDIFAGTIALQDLTFVAARPLGHIVDIVSGKRDFYFGKLLDFAPFRNDQRANFTGSLTNTRRNFFQPARSFNGR